MNARNAHLAALGLVRNPFPYTPDAGCYFSTPHLEEQVVELAHCITARKGISLLTAEVGMGKSTLVRRLMADLTSQQVVSALVFNTFLQGPELLAAVLRDFGLDSAGSMAADIHILNTFLLDNHRAGRTCLLIIDDAQNLSASSLELVRLLCNLETDQEKLFQILLAGQPELEDTLSQPSLRQLRSRLVKHARLHGLNSTEIADYVRFRFDSAGSDGTLTLHTDACQLLWRETQGVPRHVHLIMDRCLYGLAARQAKVIDADLMRQAVEDSRLHLASGLQDAPPVATPTQPAGTLRMLTYAVVLLGLLGAGVLGHQLGKNVVGMPAAQATVPPAAPQVVPAVPVVDEEKMTDPCMAAAGDPAGQAASGVSLSEQTRTLFASRLARMDGVCLEQRQGQTWVRWPGQATVHALQERAVAARFQIALTHFGSLPPQEVDGLWGERSRQAMARFQEDVGLAPTGEVDALSGLLLESFYAP